LDLIPCKAFGLYRFHIQCFVANAVEWLNPANARNAQLVAKPGDPVSTRPDSSGEKRAGDHSRGTTKTVELDANANELVYGDTFNKAFIGCG